jgi:hypothetical protein
MSLLLKGRFQERIGCRNPDCGTQPSTQVLFARKGEQDGQAIVNNVLSGGLLPDYTNRENSVTISASPEN